MKFNFYPIYLLGRDVKYEIFLQSQGVQLDSLTACVGFLQDGPRRASHVKNGLPPNV